MWVKGKLDIPWYSGVMPRADTSLSVEKVHLALLCCPLFCMSRYKWDRCKMWLV